MADFETRTIIYVNPSSGQGQGREIWEKAKPLLRDIFRKLESYETPESFREALPVDDPLRVIVIGGDGTLHQVLNTLMRKRSPTAPAPELAVLSAGTGCDFTRSLGSAPLVRASRFEREFNRLTAGKLSPLDVGVAKLTGNKSATAADGADGNVHTEYFLNSCSVGLGGHALSLQTDWHRKKLPALLSYMVPGVKAFMSYEGLDSIRVSSLDGSEIYAGPSYGAMAYNGSFAGGGMKWAPSADLADGLLDIIVKKKFDKAKMAAALYYLLSERIHEYPEVICQKLPGIVVENPAGTPMPLELDGELFYASRIELRLVQGRMSVWK